MCPIYKITFQQARNMHAYYEMFSGRAPLTFLKTQESKDSVFDIKQHDLFKNTVKKSRTG